MIQIYQCMSNHKFPFNIIALIIRFIQRTNYSHYTMSVFNNGVEEFYDSTFFGVRHMSREQFLKNYTIIRGYKVGREISKENFKSFALKLLGRGYGFMQIIGLLMIALKIISKNPFGGGAKRIICNELIILFYNKFYFTGIKDTDSYDLNDTQDLIISAEKDWVDYVTSNA